MGTWRDLAHQKVEPSQEKHDQQCGSQTFLGSQHSQEVRAQPQRLKLGLVQSQDYHKDLQGFIQRSFMMSPRGPDEGNEAWTRVTL